MKCINCQTDNNLRDRTANYGRCSSCNHEFVFEPKALDNKDRVTDDFFVKLLANVSAEGTIFHTNKQLYYQLDYKVKRKNNYLIGGWPDGYVFIIFMFFTPFSIFASIVPDSTSITVGGGITFICSNLFFIWLILGRIDKTEDRVSTRRRSIDALKNVGASLIFLAIVQMFSPYALTAILTLLAGAASIGLYLKQKSKSDLLYEDWGIDRGLFDNWLQKWQSINGRVDRILPPPQLLAVSPNIDPDVTAYSFDRLVVTDRSEIAHFLIANNFHFEHNCAVLSIDEYPNEIFDTVMTMLRRNEDLQVFALHDASPEGVSLIDRLRTSDRWFATQPVTIIDLGLLPRQILDRKSAFAVRNSSDNRQSAQSLNPAVKQSLSPAELAWIESGNYVELESIPPLRLLQAVQQGISRSRDLIAAGGDDGGLIIFDDNDGNLIYTVDSFG